MPPPTAALTGTGTSEALLWALPGATFFYNCHGQLYKKHLIFGCYVLWTFISDFICFVSIFFLNSLKSYIRSKQWRRSLDEQT